MALFRPGAIIAAISGRLGGAIFATPRTGSVVRNTPIKTSRTTPATSTAYIALVQALRAWQALSEAQQFKWRSLAASFPQHNRLGVAFRLTGRELFIRQNVPRYRAHFTPLLYAPDNVNTAETIVAELGFGGGYQYHTANSEPLAQPVQAFLYARTSRSPYSAGSRTFHYVGASEENTLATFNVPSLAAAVFGTLPSESLIDLRFITTSTDRLLFQQKTIVWKIP
jgi:hypothetical protein